MELGNYPTPAQVSIFMGDVWLDDAYRVEIRDNNPIVPLYGYADKEFTAVAQGRRIINGSLIINYRYPEYLRAAIDGMGKKKVEMSRTVALAHALRTTSIEDRVALLEEARMRGIGDEIRDVFIENYAPPKSTEFNAPEGKHESWQDSVLSLPSTMNINPQEEIQLVIWFDTPERSRYYTIVEGVRLVGRAMTISNAAAVGDASSSGQNLFELYTFFARRIVSRKTNRYLDPTYQSYGASSEQEFLDSLSSSPVNEGSQS